MRRIVFGVVLLAALASTVSGQTKPAQLGFVKDGRYHHVRTGVELRLLPGWNLRNTSVSSDGGEQAYFENEAVPGLLAEVWMKSIDETPERAGALLEVSTSAKRAQRISEGAQEFRYRPGSVYRTYVTNHAAQFATAEYVMRGRRLTEYFAWIYTGKTHVLFHVRGAESEVFSVQARWDQIIQFADIP